MSITEKERRRWLLASAAIAIALLLPTVACKPAPALKTRRGELDRRIADIIGRDSTEARRVRGTERDVNAEFVQAPFTMHLPVGRRTSLIIDPPNGRMPPLTAEAQKARDVLRQFQLALLQPTSACKEQLPGCAGGKYGAVSPRRNQTPPMYVSGAGGGTINRADGPEDRSLSERCLGGTL